MHALHQYHQRQITKMYEQEGNAYLRTVIDAIPDVLFAQDANGRIQMANKVTAEVLGRPVGEVVGGLHRNLSAFPEDVGRLEEQIREVLETGEGSATERTVYHPVTGAATTFETRVIPLIPPDGGPMQTLVVGTDITARRTAEFHLRVAQQEILTRLAHAAEYRDDDTGKHTRRVGLLAQEIGRLLGLHETAVELLGEAAPLHDIGKIGIPDSILLKPGRLTPEEYAVMKRHTLIGGGILSGSSSELMKLAEEVALSHHERWDGAGYPNGFHEDETSLSSRIVAVADVIDALSHALPYRPAWALPEVIGELRENRGRSFDPECVDASLEILASPERLAQIQEEDQNAA